MGNLLCKEFMIEPCCALCRSLSTWRVRQKRLGDFFSKVVHMCLLSIDNLVLTTKGHPFYLGCTVPEKTLPFWGVHQGARLRHMNRKRENCKYKANGFQMTWASRWLGSGHQPLLRTGGRYPRTPQEDTPLLNDQENGVLGLSSLGLMKWL